MHSDVGEFLGANFAFCVCQSDGSFSQRRSPTGRRLKPCPGALNVGWSADAVFCSVAKRFHRPCRVHGEKDPGLRGEGLESSDTCYSFWTKESRKGSRRIELREPSHSNEQAAFVGPGSLIGRPANRSGSAPFPAKRDSRSGIAASRHKQRDSRRGRARISAPADQARRNDDSGWQDRGGGPIR